ncbi:MAG: hypothetical protein AAB922_07755 [Patescibacteria group bacterium]
MNPRQIKTIVRWAARASTPIIIDEWKLFLTAYYWKYKKKNDWQVTQCYIAYARKRVVPDFVKEFVVSEIYPCLVAKTERRLP